MTRYPISGSPYTISKSLDFYRDDHPVSLPKYDDLVEIELFGITRRLSPLWLLGWAYYGYNDFKTAMQIKLRFVEITPTARLFPLVPEVRITKSWERDPSYRYCPLCWSIVVDQTGCVRYARTGKKLKAWMGKTSNAYPTISVAGERKLNLVVHKAVAATWVANPDPVNLVIVNHIDGNKLNCDYSNLEWVTMAENAQHALRNNLYTQALEIRLRDFRTGEETVHPSLSSALRHTGAKGLRTANAKDCRRRSERDYLFGGVYELRFPGDTRPWLYTQTVVGPARAALRIVLRDGETVTQYNGCSDIVRKYRLWNLGTGWNKLKPVLLERYPSVSILSESYNQPRDGIEVREESDGSVAYYASASIASTKLGIPKGKIKHWCHTDGKRLYDGRRYRWKSDALWPTGDDRITNVQKITSKDKESGEVTVFASMRAAERGLGVSRSILTRMINSPRPEDPMLVSNE